MKRDRQHWYRGQKAYQSPTGISESSVVRRQEDPGRSRTEGKRRGGRERTRRPRRGGLGEKKLKAEPFSRQEQKKEDTIS